jgi:cysteinyl-tRNA synthetase
MQLYNTLSRKKEEFKPIKKGEILFYQCGPTVYSTQHIGNLRASVLADTILRIFIYNNYQVKFARNYTDVGHLVSDGDQGGDKMEKGVKREGLSPMEIANKYIKSYYCKIKTVKLLYQRNREPTPAVSFVRFHTDKPYISIKNIKKPVFLPTIYSA